MIELPLYLNDITKLPMLLNVEQGVKVKNIIISLAKKREINGINQDKITHLPNFITGVVIYFIIKGLKEEFNIKFDQLPVSLKQRNKRSKSGNRSQKLSRNKKRHHQKI